MGKMRPKVLGTEDEAKQKEKEKVRHEQKKLRAPRPRQGGAEGGQSSGLKEHIAKPVEESRVKPKEKKEAGVVIPSSPSSPSSPVSPLSPVFVPSPTPPKSPAPAGRPELPKVPKPPKSSRSAAYRRAKALTDRTKPLPVNEALALLPKIHLARFNETVELVLNVVDKNVKATLTLPHIAGKKARVATFSEKRAVIDGKEIATGDFLKNIEEGKIDFAVLLASPAVIPSLARFAKILGPRGLMPNPKAGTICPNPEKEAEKFSAGQITLKPVSESFVIQTVVGKLSSPAKDIEENIVAIFTALGPIKIASAFLKSTMSPAVRLKI